MYHCFICKKDTNNLVLHNLTREHYLKAKNQTTQRRFTTEKIRSKIHFEKLQKKIYKVQKNDKSHTMRLSENV